MKPVSPLRLITTSLALLMTSFSFAQSNAQIAHDKGMQAVKLEDEGNYKEAIKLLKEAQKLDPETPDYPYEIGYSYYAMKEYKKAVAYFEPLLKDPKAYDLYFAMLGNAYDDWGKSDKAMEVYEAGIKKYPNSGRLYLEKGNLFWQKKEYEKAIPFYEQGVQADPGFPSNYYRLAKLFCASSEKVWGMIYGELFMNLERNSDRTAEISALLYNTYDKALEYSSDTSMSVHFCKNMTMSIDELTSPDKIKLPYCMTYETIMSIAMAFEKNVDINSLTRIRANFLDNYYSMGRNIDYPNALFEYQKKIKDAGQLEAYSHWILMKGNEDGFVAWKDAHKEAYDSFVSWFTANQLELSESNFFVRGQY